MAKVLDALERARREREKKMQPPLGPPKPIDPLLCAVGPETPIAKTPAARPPASARARSPRRGISDKVIAAYDNQSPVTEQVRQIRTNLETVLVDYRSRTLVVTSPISGDGKSLVAANLATVLADSPEQRILIVDADMRKGDQHQLFGVCRDPGLSDYLRDRCPLAEAIHDTALPNLKIMPVGPSPEKPTVLLGSDRMLAMIGELQRSFRWIVFDSPPLLPVTDALVLARECVGLIFVVRMGQTNRNTIIRAQDLLAEMRLPVLGCILNDFSSNSEENAYYYRYYKRGDGQNGGAP